MQRAEWSQLMVIYGRELGRLGRISNTAHSIYSLLDWHWSWPKDGLRPHGVQLEDSEVTVSDDRISSFASRPLRLGLILAWEPSPPALSRQPQTKVAKVAGTGRASFDWAHRRHAALPQGRRKNTGLLRLHSGQVPPRHYARRRREQTVKGTRPGVAVPRRGKMPGFPTKIVGKPVKESGTPQ